jgi:hypothetical protein
LEPLVLEAGPVMAMLCGSANVLPGTSGDANGPQELHQTSSRVTAISRAGFDKVKTNGRSTCCVADETA